MSLLRFEAGQWENLDELEAESFLKEIRPEAEVAMKRVLLMFEREVKQTLTGTRSGRTYRVPLTKGGTGARLHVASAPGEPPAVLFGNLRNSIGHTGPKWSGWTVEGEFGPGLGQGEKAGRDAANAYARRMEYGGSDSRGVHIHPRPYMEPTVQRQTPEADRIFREVGSR